MKRSKKSKVILLQTRRIWDPETKTAAQQVRYERADGTRTKTQTFDLTESSIVGEIDSLSTLLVALRTGIDPVPSTSPTD